MRYYNDTHLLFCFRKMPPCSTTLAEDIRKNKGRSTCPSFVRRFYNERYIRCQRSFGRRLKVLLSDFKRERRDISVQFLDMTLLICLQCLGFSFFATTADFVSDLASGLSSDLCPADAGELALLLAFLTGELEGLVVRK